MDRTRHDSKPWTQFNAMRPAMDDNNFTETKGWQQTLDTYLNAENAAYLASDFDSRFIKYSKDASEKMHALAVSTKAKIRDKTAVNALLQEMQQVHRKHVNDMEDNERDMRQMIRRACKPNADYFEGEDD